MRTRARRLVLVLAFAAAATGCGPQLDITKAIQLDIVETGWFDAGLVAGQNKIVPTVTFRLKNVSDQKLVTLQVNALFRRVNETTEWGSSFVTAAGSEGLAPGATTPALTLRSDRGYTGSDSRQQMLQNSQFVDAKVELFAKYGSGQWAKIAERQVARQLLAR